MAVMALLTTLPKHVRPLWAYWSGTLGDLVLPVIIYGFTEACARLKSTSRPEVLAGTYVTAAVGALIGALSQVAWLFDATPRLNWLLVAPHTFSFAGWYHAAYLTITSAYVAGISWELLARARLVPREGVSLVLGGRGAAMTMIAIEIFVITVVADSIPSSGTSSSQATIAIIVSSLGVLVALAAWRIRGAVLVLFRPFALSLAITVPAVLILAASR
jgi:hypothetical protein